MTPYEARYRAITSPEFVSRIGTLLIRLGLSAVRDETISPETRPIMLGVVREVIFDNEKMALVATRIVVSIPGMDIALAENDTNFGSNITDEQLSAALYSQWDILATVWEV